MIHRRNEGRNEGRNERRNEGRNEGHKGLSIPRKRWKSQSGKKSTKPDHLTETSSLSFSSSSNESELSVANQMHEDTNDHRHGKGRLKSIGFWMSKLRFSRSKNLSSSPFSSLNGQNHDNSSKAETDSGVELLWLENQDSDDCTSNTSEGIAYVCNDDESEDTLRALQYTRGRFGLDKDKRDKYCVEAEADGTSPKKVSFLDEMDFSLVTNLPRNAFHLTLAIFLKTKSYFYHTAEMAAPVYANIEQHLTDACLKSFPLPPDNVEPASPKRSQSPRDPSNPSLFSDEESLSALSQPTLSLLCVETPLQSYQCTSNLGGRGFMRRILSPFTKCTS